MVAALALLPSEVAAAAAPVDGRELGEWHASGEVTDTVVRPATGARAAAARTERFTDSTGTR